MPEPTVAPLWGPQEVEPELPIEPAPPPLPPVPVPIPTVMSRPECLASLPARTPGDRFFATRWDPARRYCERSGVAWVSVEETPALRLDPYLEGGLIAGGVGINVKK